MEKELKLQAVASPHIHQGVTVRRIMGDVLIACLFPLFGAIYFFGLYSLWLVLISVASAVATEAVLQKIFGGKITVGDLSAAVTGVLLAFNLPPNSPWWLAAVGSFFAIAVVKLPFGGLGKNILNPALAARAFLLISWPDYMTTWIKPLGPGETIFSRLWRVPPTDAVTGATPLALFKWGKFSVETATGATPAAALLKGKAGFYYTTLPGLWNLFIGKVGGCLGETSALLLIIGGLYLLYRHVITWHIPVAYILSFALVTGTFSGAPLFHILAGGVMLGAFYMATDYVTSPITPKGQLIYGAIAGALGAAIRLWSNYPEGVSFGILLANLLTPLIDRFVKPRRYGSGKHG